MWCAPARRSFEKLSDYFGISAPGNTVFKEIGITGKSVVKARELLLLGFCLITQRLDEFRLQNQGHIEFPKPGFSLGFGIFEFFLESL